MGRPSKYKPEFVEQAAKLCALGATDEDMAGFFSVHVDTIAEWKTRHKEFSDAVKESKAAADAIVERRLFERATGYSHPETHVSNFQGAITLTPLVKHYAPDTTAAIFWLKNRKPTAWRDIKAVELSGDKDAPVSIEFRWQK